MNISIIIIHWNTPELLKKQLVDLTQKDMQIIVVDNASEKSLAWVKKSFPTVTLIKNRENLGYARACNIGTKHAKGEWLLFLNPDVEITPSLIEQLGEEATKKNLDATSPRTNEDYNKPLPAPLSLLAEFTPLKWILPLSIFKKRTLFGGCLLIKKHVLNQIGGWDEDFLLWFEDSDLTKRLIDKGYTVEFVNMKVAHIGAASFDLLPDSNRKKIFFESMSTYAKKHLGFWGTSVVSLLKKRYT